MTTQRKRQGRERQDKKGINTPDIISNAFGLDSLLSCISFLHLQALPACCVVSPAISSSITNPDQKLPSIDLPWISLFHSKEHKMWKYFCAKNCLNLIVLFRSHSHRQKNPNIVIPWGHPVEYLVLNCIFFEIIIRHQLFLQIFKLIKFFSFKQPPSRRRRRRRTGGEKSAHNMAFRGGSLAPATDRHWTSGTETDEEEEEGITDSLNH